MWFLITNMEETVQKQTRPESATSQLAILADLSRELTGYDDPLAALERCSKGSRDLIFVERVLLVILSDDRSSHRYIVTTGVCGDAHDEAGANLPAGDLVNRLLEEPVCWRVGSQPDPATLGLPQSFAPLRNSLCVPIRSSSRSYGWICLANKAGAEEFTDLDAHLALILGAQAAKTYEVSRRLQEVQQGVTRLEGEIDERRKAERELRQLRDRLEMKTDELVADLARTNAALRIEIEGRTRLTEEREKLVSELQDATRRLKAVSGVLPICATCKKVRDGYGGWQSIESYLKALSDAGFSHSICPDCEKKLYEELQMVRG